MRGIGALGTVFLAALWAHCVVDAAQPAVFEVSIDKVPWKKWGFRYPATYAFEVTGIGADARARRLDGQTGS